MSTQKFNSFLLSGVGDWMKYSYVGVLH